MAVYLNKKTLLDVSSLIKQRNRRIVLTHGSFDLFHLGHATLLRKSKNKGDYLAVGIDSDERVSMYKGLGRPIVPHDNRMEVMLENKSVDFVFPINSPDMSNNYFLDFYNKLSPDTITFGEQMAFKSKFDECSRQLEFISFDKIPHVKNITGSSTQIIDRIKNPRKFN